MRGSDGDDLEEFCIVLIGDYPELAEKEVIFSLDSAGFKYENLGRIGLLLFIKSHSNIAGYLSWRCAMVRYVIRLFYKGDPEKLSEINADFEGTFAVRIHSYDREYKDKVNLIERRIGEIFYSKGKHVDLENPEVLIMGYIKDGILYLGFLEAKGRRSELFSRRPSKRPAFHPSSMMPDNARLMVNLAKAQICGIFLDPFCGVGGILLEAALISEHCIGIDIDWKMIKGCSTNVKHYGLYNVDLIRADATKLPLRRIGNIACDTPYGIAASLKGRNHAKLVSEFLESLKSYGNSRVCMATIIEDLNPSGFKVLLKHPQRIRKSLIRWLYVLELDGDNISRNSG